MSRKSRPTTDDGAAPSAKLDIQRIRVNAEGYDRGGAYWGAGPDVFIASTPDGTEQVTIRAANLIEARQKAAKEMAANGPPAGTAEREPIGGHPTRKSRIHMEWRNAITGQTVRLRVTHSRNYLTTGSDHIEIEAVEPKRAMLPITETGYRSHFIKSEDVDRCGGVRRFVTEWLASAAASKPWQRSQQAAKQGDLFQWAQAQQEIAVPRKQKSKRPAAKPAKAVKRMPKPA
jgi:hypothetical protein